MAPNRLLLILGCALLPLVLIALMMGPVFISPASLLHALLQALGGTGEGRVTSQDGLILFSIRFPRVLLAGLVGVCLAVCGTAMQGLFRNPLADPSLIGVSSGASAGASLMIVLGGGALLEGGQFAGLSVVALGAFAGGFLAVILVYRLATSSTGTSVATMLLAGIAISALAGALNSLLSFVADDEMLRRISLWQMGSLDAANWPRVWIAAAAVAVVMLLLPREGAALNAFLLGESEARHLGIAVDAVKRRLILMTAMAIGISVAVAGTISFVGLIVPHIIRLLIGPDHRYLIPASALAGAMLLIVADAFARVVVAPAELPAGILTALLGTPFFLSLLAQKRRVGEG
ncbi:MAG: iron ABC transporter permease [Halioglobus sp.]|nr:iron ABC transporter permease [Halioglobus sp.]